MVRKTLQWVNTPVLMEAILRYEKGLLHRSMKLWVEKLLDIEPDQQASIFLNTDKSNKKSIRT